MKKIFLLSLFALSGLLVLSSCGDDTKTGDDSGSGGGSGTTDGEPSGGNSGGSTQNDNGLKAYAAISDTMPIYILTYTANSKLDSFVYVRANEPSFCKVVYNNNVPTGVKVYSFNNYFDIDTNTVVLDGTKPIYYVNMSDNSYYPALQYSYANYANEKINVKQAGADLYKIKLNGEVESTYFKKIDSNGLKTGFYDNKLENNKLYSSSFEGKVEVTYDGSKLSTKNYIARGDKFQDYGETTYEIKDTYAETKMTRPSAIYNKTIDYSSSKATIDSNFNVTSILSKTFIKGVSQAGNQFILETPIESTKTRTLEGDTSVKYSYPSNGNDIEVLLTYNSGKLVTLAQTGGDSFSAEYTYPSDSEIKLDLYGPDPTTQHMKNEYKYNAIGQTVEINKYDDGVHLSQAKIYEYNDKSAVSKITEISGNSKRETVCTYNDEFTQQTSVTTSYNADTVTGKTKSVATYGTTMSNVTYVIDGTTETKNTENSTSFVNGVNTTSYIYYDASGNVKSSNIIKTYFNDDLIVTKEETYQNGIKTVTNEYTYDTNKKLVSITVTNHAYSTINITEYTYNGNVLTECAVINKPSEDTTGWRKVSYTFTNNYQNVESENYKWDTETNQFVPDLK